jgi:ATP-dependent RNA circularization protein (DNA/RNA ligase family)
MEPAEARELLRRRASVEEKVDGANLGISVGREGRLRAQSRGHYLEPGTGGQWRPLWQWLALRERELTLALSSSLVLFGEWCYAEHSVSYDELPDWMLVFDVYDRTAQRYWSRPRRDDLAEGLGLSVVPLLGEGTYGEESLRRFMSHSLLGRNAAEGVYLRWDEGNWLVARAKVVRPGWVMAGDEHWSSRLLQTNRLKAASVGAAG